VERPAYTFVKLLLMPWLCVCALVVDPTPAAVFPVGQPEYDFLYERQLRREATHLDRFDTQVGPYVLDRFDGALGPLTAWLESDSGGIHVFGFAAEDFRAARETDPGGYESLRAGLTGQPLEHVSVYADFVLDEELADDPFYRGKKWRGFAGDVDQAFVACTTHGVNALAGRFGGFWGPRRSLLFSPDQKLDGLAYSVRWGRLTVSYRLGQLDGLDPDEHEVNQFEPRYIAAHRLDWHFGSRFRLGLFETVVFGGPGRQIDLLYLNPLISFHAAQLNENLDDNTMVGFDFDLQPGSGVLVYGQFLVDDLQVDNKTRGDQEPGQLGILAGGYLADLLPQTDLQVEYQHVSNWTFNQVHERNRYLNDGRPIGAGLGNDYDLADFKLIRWWSKFFQSSLRFSYYRQGEGRIDAPWTAPWIEFEGDYSEPFPSGIVQRTATLAVGLRGFVTGFVFADLEAGVEWMRNRTHIAGDNPTLPFVRLYLSVFGLAQFRAD